MRTDLITQLKKTAEELKPDTERQHLHREHFATQVQARPQTSRVAIKDIKDTRQSRAVYKPLLLAVLILVTVVFVGIRYTDTIQSMFGSMKQTAHRATVWLYNSDTTPLFSTPEQPAAVRLKSEDIQEDTNKTDIAAFSNTATNTPAATTVRPDTIVTNKKSIVLPALPETVFTKDNDATVNTPEKPTVPDNAADIAKEKVAEQPANKRVVPANNSKSTEQPI